jgi:SAM-dependent methyltransferase
MTVAPTTPEIEAHNATQRKYFSHEKRGMRPRSSTYLARQTDELVTFAGIEPGMRILDVGCGQGRYTLPLARRGIRVEGLDLSPAMVEALRRAAERSELAIPLHEADVLHPPAELDGAFEAVVGFFTLHHLHDVEACLASMVSLLAPNGRIAFLEPNPYNPLYYVQMATRRSMTWQGDGGIVRMRKRPLLEGLAAAGIEERRFARFGFFPPFIADRRGAATIERRLERIPALRPVLPFQLVGGRRPG